MPNTPEDKTLFWPEEAHEGQATRSVFGAQPGSLKISPSFLSQRVIDWPQPLVLDWFDENTIEQLESQMKSCKCGCGQESARDFLPGHDQKLRVALETRAGGLLALGSLVSASEAYASGVNTETEFLKEVRAVFSVARKGSGAA